MFELSLMWFGLAIISQHLVIDLELLKSEPNSPQSHMSKAPPPPSASPAKLPPGRQLELEDILHQEIQKCVYNLIVACGEAGKNGVLAAREELGMELEAVTAHRDLLHNELSQEHHWISVLEETLCKHNIIFPDYPF